MCFLKGYLHIKCGKGKKIMRQEIELESFCHSHPPNYPSQIALITDALYSYRELYDEFTTISTNKDNNMQDISENTLKS